MGTITIENNSFIYVEAGQKKVLLDCNDYLSNKSRIPMHSMDGAMTIPRLLLQLLKDHSQYLNSLEAEGESLRYLLMDVLLVSYLIRSPAPIKAVELGADHGAMSYHLATLLGSFNRQSLFCGVSNTIGNESGNKWVERIAMVQAPPRLSMLAADYESTELQEGNFDMVVLNGSLSFREPYDVVLEAKRLVKESGIILCYAEDQPLLESSFALAFSEREEYNLSPKSRIMLARPSP